MSLLRLDTLGKRYDGYVSYYNGAESKMTAYSELVIIKKGIQDQIDETEELIDHEVEKFKQDIESICDETFYKGQEDKDALDDLKDNTIEQVQWMIDGGVHITRPEAMLGEIHQLLDEIYALKSEEDKAKLSKNFISNITWFGEKCESAIYHLEAIKPVLEKIIEKSYPPNLQYFKKLTSKEKEIIKSKRNLRNKTAEDIAKRSDEIREHFDSQIFEEANELLKDQREKCLTKSGNASSYLFKTIHRKLDDKKLDGKTVEKPGASTVKNRLNKWLKSGKL